MMLDFTDRAILNRLQDGFPIAAEPFAEVARELGIAEADLIARLQAMKDAGVITRFGPFLDAAAMGGAFCLCAMAVPEADFDRVAEIVNARAEVAHNYRRSHALNMWFVLATETEPEIARVAAELTQASGHEVLCFPKLQEFFVGFRMAA